MEKTRKYLEKNGPGMYGYLFGAVLLVFAVLAWIVYRVPGLSAAMMGVGLILLGVQFAVQRAGQERLRRYIEETTYGAGLAQNSTMLYFPLPVMIYMLDRGRVVWGNQAFFSICGRRKPSLDLPISELVPGFDGQWLTEGKRRCADLVTVDDRRYQVYGNLVRQNTAGLSVGMGITYWVDVTDYQQIKREYADSRPVVMLIMIDNYDELVRGATDRVKAELRSRIDDKLDQWTAGSRGILRRFDRESYLFICDRRTCDRLAEARFSVLESAHDVVNISGIRATVSVGVGLDGASYEDDFGYARAALDMAISRGGDQAVVRDRMNFRYYGGREPEVETRTRVRSRVAATALGSFIRDASDIYVMGHSYPDMDALGAAAGICCIARSYGKHAHIVLSDRPNACAALVSILKRQKEYADVFISPKDAMVQSGAHSLLVVVDTNRPEGVEDRPLLESISRVVVIDHHRRGSSYIDHTALTLCEPYASSVCELVVELLQDLCQQKDILPYEANALLSGIVTDTKNFTIRTGERTFDAAAYLRRCGADTVAIKRFLQVDYDSAVERYAILERARVYNDSICVAVMDRPVDRTVAAQASDELLNISGIEASVVMYPDVDGRVIISARSIGTVNVQVLLEKLGGGGNQSAAGAQLEGTDIEQASARLYAAIDEYLGDS